MGHSYPSEGFEEALTLSLMGSHPPELNLVQFNSIQFNSVQFNLIKSKLENRVILELNFPIV